jgi:hypothetical protein
MEPPKPTKRADVLRNAPQATPEEYDEYEKLLARHFTKDPAKLRGLAGAPDPEEVRLKELTKKLFGTS